MNMLRTSVSALALTACLAGTARASNGVFDFLDPCVKATDEFHAERASVLTQADRAIADADRAPSTPEYRAAWMKAKNVQLRPMFDKYVAADLKDNGVTDLDGAYQKWFARQLRDMGDATVNQLIDSSFHQELKQVRIEQRTHDAAQLQAAQTELDGACKADVGNQALRVTMGVVLAPFNIIGGNIAGAGRESGVIDQGLKATTGISVKDIKEHGIFGGPNSVFRKPFG